MIELNGKEYYFAGRQSVNKLLEQLKYEDGFSFLNSSAYPAGVILHGYIVPSVKFAETMLTEGDKVLVLPYLARG